jgi:formyl-CoA transferase
MLDAMASLLTFNAGMYFATGDTPRRRGNAHPTIAPYETFEASDGWINIGVANDKFWALFCDVLGRPVLRDDARFARAPDRAAHRVALKAALEPLIRAEGRRHWVERLGAAGIPCGEIKTVGEVCEAPQLAERGQIRAVPHPAAGPVRYVASAIRFADTAASRRPPPRRAWASTRARS